MRDRGRDRHTQRDRDGGGGSWFFLGDMSDDYKKIGWQQAFWPTRDPGILDASPSNGLYSRILNSVLKPF